MDRKTVMQLATEAFVIPATVTRYLRGEPVKGMTVDKLKAAAKTLGIELPEPASAGRNEPAPKHRGRSVKEPTAAAKPPGAGRKLVQGG